MATCSASRSPTSPISRARRGSPRISPGRRVTSCATAPTITRWCCSRRGSWRSAPTASSSQASRSTRSPGNAAPSRKSPTRTAISRNTRCASSGSGVTCRAATGTPMSTTRTATPTSSITASSRSAGTNCRSRNRSTTAASRRSRRCRKCRKPPSSRKPPPRASTCLPATNPTATWPRLMMSTACCWHGRSRLPRPAR
jgi:hypothetical protein